jgi:hypothetical protein
MLKQLLIIRDKKFNKTRQIALCDDVRDIQRTFVDTIPNHPNPQDYDLIHVGTILVPDEITDEEIKEIKFLKEIKTLVDGNELIDV